MRRVLLTTSGLIALATAGVTVAQTTVDTKRTTSVRTSTAGTGGGDIRITAAGAVNPTSGTAVTIDSNHAVANAGTIQLTGANDANGIFAQAGVRGGIANSGKILVDETYTPTDTDKDGDLDGPFAQGIRRAGIRTAGAFAGTIANAGEITVEGNDSAGIFLGGPLNGAFTHEGKTDVLGDRGVGVRLENVTGAVTLGGTVTARGQSSVAARLDGNVTGALVVHGTVASTGYRSTTTPASTAKLDADDLLQGGAALVVGGNVSGGIVLGNATGKVADVAAFGFAPAFQIGAANRSVMIGPVAGRTPVAGLVIDGRVTGNGVYTGGAATGLAVGGLGSEVTIASGISIGGMVQATAVNANATAVRVGAGATTPELRVTGTVAANGGAAGTVTNAVLIEAGGTVPTIRNAGTIRATASGTAGSATAILDRSGRVVLVENSGTIAATGADAARAVAIDLSAGTTGTVIRQSAGAAGAAAPVIAGAIRFGLGDDALEIGAGRVAGDVSFGAGGNRLVLTNAGTYAGTATFGTGADSVTIAGTSRFEGTADFGGGMDRLSIADRGVFLARIAGGSALAVTVAPGGGTFGTNGAATIGSLTLGNQSILSVALDKGTSNLIQVTGATTIGTGSQLAIRVAGGSDITGRYVVLRSGTLTGAANLTLADTAVPFLYKGALVATMANEIAVDVLRKANTELGFNRGQARAFTAIDTAIGNDAKVAAAVRGIYAGDAFRSAVDQLLPNHAGGVFESVTLGSRATARQLLEPAGEYGEEGSWGFWLTPVGWDASKDRRETQSYDVRGWGISSGIERKTALGNFGVSLAYLSGRDSEGAAVNRIDHDQYELAAQWRGHWGGIAASARGSYAFISFDGVRQFDGTIETEKVQRRATADWNGSLWSGAGSLSYEHVVGAFSLRPIVALDYYRLSEDAYVERGGGRAVDLTVRKRTSDELALSAGLAAGYNVGGSNRYDQWTRIEIEGGRRERLAGALGRTTASFGSGPSFTLDPEARDGGWIGKVRAVTGSTEIRLSGEVSAEQRLGNAALAARAGLQFAF